MENDNLWGITGVIIGSMITLISQYILEIRKERIESKKTFLKNHYMIYQNIIKIKNAINQFNSFIDMDLSIYNKEDLEQELIPSIIYFSKECSKNWIDFRDDLLGYFFNVMNEKSFIILDDLIKKIANINSELNNMDIEIFTNNHTFLQSSKPDFNNAIVIITSIEKEYNRLRNRFIKKRF